MTIEFTLEIHNKDNNLLPDIILDYLYTGFNLERNKLSGILSGKGYTINSFLDNDIYRESSFGSQNPDLIVSFIIDKFDDHEIGINNMVKTVLAIMQKLKEDMILLFDDDEILLKRTSGSLVVNSDADFWETYSLSIADMSYKKEPIEML